MNRARDARRTRFGGDDTQPVDHGVAVCRLPRRLESSGKFFAIARRTLGALITTWTTFAPCFLWILLGAPHIEKLRGNESLSSALSTVTAAVVGVILNLAVWLACISSFPRPEMWIGLRSRFARSHSSECSAGNGILFPSYSVADCLG
jgi:hypothetical protein